MTSDEQLRLNYGTLNLVLEPRVGGSIASFERLKETGERVPVMRRAPEGASDILAMACFPLVPYCNRIRDGRFAFRGRDVRIAPNMAGDPSPLHGQGWLSSWQIEDADDRSGALGFHHEAGEWLWSYDARQQFVLDESGLAVRLSCRNLSADPMPCGLGLHPYFPCTAQTELDTAVEDVWTVDANVLPVERIPARGRYDLRRRRIYGQSLDNGFSGWSGSATIRRPEDGFEVRIASPDAHFFQIYSPAAGGFFVAEPVSHANAALNEPEARWPSLGLKVLAQGEEMELNARFDVVATR